MSGKLTNVESQEERVTRIGDSSEIDEFVHAQIDDLERTMLTCSEVLTDLPVRHTFTDGLYIRECVNPARTLLTTKIHKTEHPFVLLVGAISILNPDGTSEYVEAPYMTITKHGTRRVIFAHIDSVVATFHPNPDNCHDIAILEDRLIERRELTDGKSAYELAIETMKQSLKRSLEEDGSLS